MTRSPWIPLAAWVFCAGCASTWHDARFFPSPLEVGVTAHGEPRAEARALLSVRGVRRAREEQPAEVEVHLRLENLGEVPLTLDPEGFDLVTSDLVSFRAPVVEPSAGTEVAPGAQERWVLRFATPEERGVDDLDWSGINVRFRVRFGERSILTGVTFDRSAGPWRDGYYDPWWGPYPYRGPRWNVGIGVGVTN
ncbi:MAG TPA: hypothetical protein VMT18_04480 [Planctomycetota bacterium]|nr:hypothetical protein [Planctomycetota bacterium]